MYHDAQQVFPKVHRGCDFGINGKVLVVKGNKKLVLFPGHSYYYNIHMGTTYVPVHVTFFDGGAPPTGKTVLEGGRMSKKRFLEISDKLDTLFESEGVAEKIDTKKTLVLED